jgi:hypothetical protein
MQTPTDVMPDAFYVIASPTWPRSVQQPDGGGTPGVAVAPVALAGAIMAGFARLMLTLSLHAAEFGVGTTVMVGSMLVPPRSAVTG